MPTAVDILSQDLVSVDAESTVGDTIDLLVREGIGGAPVMRDGQLVGIVTELELFDVLFDPKLRQRPVSEVMETNVCTIDESESLTQVVHTIALHGVRRLPVLRDGKTIGIISRRDLLKFSAEYGESVQDPLTELMPSLDEETS